MSVEGPDEAEQLAEALAQARRELDRLRTQPLAAPGQIEALEERLLESKGQLAQATSQNEKLTFTLQQAKEQLAALREEVEKLTQPPAAYGTFLGVNEDGTGDVFSSGRKMRVSLHPDIDPGVIRKGNEVVLNESLNVVLVRDGDLAGEEARTPGHHHDPRGHVDGLLHVVGHEYDGRPSIRPQPQNVVGQGAAGDLVQGREGFVEQ